MMIPGATMTPILLNTTATKNRLKNTITESKKEAERLEDLLSAPKSYLVNAAQFQRVFEFSNKHCILKIPVEEDGQFSDQSRFLQHFKGQPRWICQLDADVNLRSVIHLPVGYYQCHWVFAYNLDTEYLQSTHGMQAYNCSMGKPLDAAMFQSRTTDPSQPFISNKLNAIILPRCTSALQVPTYETLAQRKSPEDVMLRRKNKGEVVLRSETLKVDWDGPTAFLIKLVSQRILEGELFFLGVILVGSRNSIVGQWKLGSIGDS